MGKRCFTAYLNVSMFLIAIRLAKAPTMMKMIVSSPVNKVCHTDAMSNISITLLMITYRNAAPKA